MEVIHAGLGKIVNSGNFGNFYLWNIKADKYL